MLDGVWDSQLENEKEAKNLRRQNIIKILQQNTIQFFLSATVAKLLFSVAENSIVAAAFLQNDSLFFGLSSSELFPPPPKPYQLHLQITIFQTDEKSWFTLFFLSQVKTRKKLYSTYVVTIVMDVRENKEVLKNFPYHLEKLLSSVNWN